VSKGIVQTRNAGHSGSIDLLNGAQSLIVCELFAKYESSKVITVSRDDLEWFGLLDAASPVFSPKIFVHHTIVDPFLLKKLGVWASSLV
jgi:hypothetical protein